MKHYQWTAFLSISSEHSKPYMILKALCKGFQEIYRFAMLRSLGKEWQPHEVTLWTASPPRPSWRWLAASSLAEAVEVADGRTTGCHLQMISSPGLGEQMICRWQPVVRPSATSTTSARLDSASHCHGGRRWRCGPHCDFAGLCRVPRRFCEKKCRVGPRALCIYSTTSP